MASNYVPRLEHGEVLACDSCNSEAPTAEFDWGPPFTAKHERPQRLLCRFCAETMAGRYTEGPTPDKDGWLRAEVWRAAACVFNLLAQELKETRR